MRLPVPSGEARVNIANGNLVLRERDLLIPGTYPYLSIDRTYNNLSTEARDLGRGWTMSTGYDVRIERPADGSLRFVGPTGHATRFVSQSDGSYLSTSPSDDVRLTRDGNVYTVVLGSSETAFDFDGNGQLIAQRDEEGNQLSFSYTSANGQSRLSYIEDPTRTRTHFSYFGTGAVHEIDDPASRHYIYDYDGRVRLTSYRGDGQTAQTYRYDDPNDLREVVYPSGGRLLVDYDAQHRVERTRVLRSDGAVISDTGFTYAAASTTVVQDGTSTRYLWLPATIQVYAPDNDQPTLTDVPEEEVASDFAGSSATEIPFVARDGTSGVRRVWVERGDGTVIAEQNGVCQSVPESSGSITEACARLRRSSISVPSGPLSPGANRVVLKVADAAGRVVARPFDVLVDNTAPNAPEDVVVDDFDAGSRRADLGIEPGEDPDIAEDVAGSGIARAELRWRRPGAEWSSWQQAEDFIVSVSGVDRGDNIEVQTRSYDASGLQSPALQKTLTVEPVVDPPDDEDEVQAPAGSGSAELTVDVSSTIQGQTADEARGWRVTVENPAGQPIVDDADYRGEASFRGLAPGQYTIRAVGVAGEPAIAEPNTPVTLQANQRATRGVTLPTDALCERYGADFAAFYCNLTDDEVAFILRHPVLSVKFFIDAQKAITRAERLFNGGDAGQIDATRANAFQHSFWTALMTKSVYDLDLFDREELALDYATRHESEARRDPRRRIRLRSEMDRHNNRVGYLFAQRRESNRKSDTRLCTGMRRAVFGGKLGRPTSQLQLYWLQRRDSQETIIRNPSRVGC